MDHPEAKDEPTPGNIGEPKTELQSLRSLIAAALVLVIVFTVCLNYCLSAQTRDMENAVGQEQLTARRFSAFATQASSFWSQLVDYSKTHPDIAPIINKWKGSFRFNTNGPAHK